MAATLDSLTADMQKLVADNTAFRTAVMAVLTSLPTIGALSAAQQAQLDNLHTMVFTEDQAVVAAHGALPAA